MIFDGQGSCQQVNSHGYNVMGAKPEDLLGSNYSEIWPENGDHTVHKAFSKALKGDTTSFQTDRNIFQGSKTAKWNVHLQPIISNDKHVDGVIATANDISKLMLLESGLEIHRTSLEAISTGITISDVSGTILYTNAAEERMHGYSKGELIGKNVALLSPNKKISQRSVEDLRRYKELTRETINERKDGTKFPIQLKSVPIKDSSGMPTGMISISEDITDKKAIELERESYMSELEKFASNLIMAEIKLKDSSLETVHVLTRAAEFKDENTGNHIKRIGLYSKFIAEMLEMDESFCQDIEYASAMHDIGKIGIPDTVLLKSDSLTDDEFKVIKKHTIMGADLLNTSSPNSVLELGQEIAMGHHEKWDGSGYPLGLSGEDIPISARIVMLADFYDAMRSDRPYRKGYTHQETLDLIQHGDGRTLPTHFDPTILNILLENDSVFNNFFLGI